MKKIDIKKSITDSITGGAIVRSYTQPPRDEDVVFKVNKGLNRIAGKIEGVRNMLDSNRPCVDIIMQLTAAQSLLRNVKTLILNDYLQHVAIDELNKGNGEIYSELELLSKMFR